MLVERSYLFIRDGLEKEFAAKMVAEGLPLLNAVEGADAVSFGRGVEQPNKFVLLIEWADMAAHTSFAKQPVFADFLALIRPYSQGGEMEHFEMR